MIPIAEIVVDPLVLKVPLMLLVAGALLLLLYYVFIGITLNMAKSRHRDPLGWILLSLFVSPILAWIVLLIVGDAK